VLRYKDSQAIPRLVVPRLENVDKMQKNLIQDVT